MEDHEILLMLNRQYGKDDLVKLLRQELSATQVELGKMKSECDRLEHELKQLDKHELKQQIKGLEKRIAILDKERLEKAENKDQLRQIKSLREQVRGLQNSNVKLITRNLALEKQLHEPGKDSAVR